MDISVRAPMDILTPLPQIHTTTPILQSISLKDTETSVQAPTDIFTPLLQTHTTTPIPQPISLRDTSQRTICVRTPNLLSRRIRVVAISSADEKVGNRRAVQKLWRSHLAGRPGRISAMDISDAVSSHAI